MIVENEEKYHAHGIKRGSWSQILFQKKIIYQIYIFIFIIKSNQSSGLQYGFPSKAFDSVLIDRQFCCWVEAQSHLHLFCQTWSTLIWSLMLSFIFETMSLILLIKRSFSEILILLTFVTTSLDIWWKVLISFCRFWALVSASHLSGTLASVKNCSRFLNLHFSIICPSKISILKRSWIWKKIDFLMNG